MNTKKTNSEIVKLDQQHNIHPYMNFKGERIIMAKGKGAYVTDLAGKEYLDGIGGLWCVNIGHGRKELAEAFAEQAETLGYFSTFVIFSNVPSTLLASKLSELAPGDLNHVYFTTGGSEANDSAVRIMHQYFALQGKPQKKHIISRVGAYHGMTYLTASISGLADNNKDYHTITDFIHHLSTPNCYRPQISNYSDSAYVDYLGKEFEDKIAKLGADKIAGFFAEPIMGAGGIYVAPKGYHARMFEICQKHDILYVSDEVVTGFCRLGEFFTTKSIFGVQPDIITAAKGITSGYAPLGAVIISDKIFNGLSAGEFTSAFTYSGHPVCTAVANRNIKIMEDEKLGEHVKDISKYLWKKLADLQDKCPYLGDVRGSHFMIGLEFVADKKTKMPFGPEFKFSSLLADCALKNGLVIRPLSNGINVISPTLIWKKAEVDKFIDILSHSIDQVVSTYSKNA